MSDLREWIKNETQEYQALPDAMNENPVWKPAFVYKKNPFIGF